REVNYMPVLVQDIICIVYFFFQAEDGIRDFHVTGVQTCALPIFALAAWLTSAAHGAEPSLLEALEANDAALATSLVRAGADVTRSEERRVGKEGRSRL